jgi:hypothetical protein
LDAHLSICSSAWLLLFLFGLVILSTLDGLIWFNLDWNNLFWFAVWFGFVAAPLYNGSSHWLLDCSLLDMNCDISWIRLISYWNNFVTIGIIL